MKAITDALTVSRSNQYERKKGRRRYGTRRDDDRYLPLVKEITGERKEIKTTFPRWPGR